MKTWEYCTASVGLASLSGDLFGGGDVSFIIRPLSKFDIALLSKTFQGAKVKNKGSAIYLTVLKKEPDSEREMILQVCDFLGSLGWEAYAADEEKHFCFKRPK